MKRIAYLFAAAVMVLSAASCLKDNGSVDSMPGCSSEQYLMTIVNDSNVKKFPCVQIEENSNLPVHIDSAGHSKYASVSLRVRIYSNKNTGRIAEARSIVGIVDSVLEPLKFYRKSFAPLNGLYNNSVYRIDCSYGATIGEDGMIYRN